MLLYLVKTIPNPSFMYVSRLLRSLSDVCLHSDQKKDDSQDYSDISRVRGEGMLEKNPVILLYLWISLTYVSCYGIKKKLMYYMFVNLVVDFTLFEC